MFSLFIVGIFKYEFIKKYLNDKEYGYFFIIYRSWIFDDDGIND